MHVHQYIGRYKVEKGVPLPPENRSVLVRYPFDGMEVGDSFLEPYPENVEVDTYVRRCYALRLANAANKYVTRRFPDKKFSTRRTDKGIRVWRIK
jgi:hypothetical protein